MADETALSGGARRLARADFERPTLVVARGLVGKFLVRRRGGRELAAMITEVEAYRGPRDLASHARGGRRTARVEPLYGPGGTVYVYLVYGLHWMLNFSTLGAERPEGVLVRAVLVDPAGAREHVDGPGRVARRLAIDGRLDGVDATTSRALWVEDRGARPRGVRIGPRIGVEYAGPYWAARPWRFWIQPELSARSSPAEPAPVRGSSRRAHGADRSRAPSGRPRSRRRRGRP